MNTNESPLTITVGARASPLSQAQAKEVLQELHLHHPHVIFVSTFVQTTGDLDQVTSLRTLEKTDFFTKEIDEMLLTGHCRIGIHSAKDLPEPLPQGLKLIALTRGVDSADVLVFRANQGLESLSPGALVATSSERREAAVRCLRDDLAFTDVRGTIEQRLAKLDRGDVDAVVIAEAALIRLGLTHRNRIRLPGETTPNQGRLAILARDNDVEMQQLFACICRK